MTETESAEQKQEFKKPEAHEKHRLFEPLAGNFTAKLTMFMGPEPTLSTGKMVNTLHINGMFLHQDYIGDSSGMFRGFVGKGYFGFSSTKNYYEGFWIDSSTDSMQIETGQVDASGKVWEMVSWPIHPSLKAKFKKRSIVTVIDNDRHTVEMLHTYPNKEEVTVVKIEYTRE